MGKIERYPYFPPATPLEVEVVVDVKKKGTEGKGNKGKEHVVNSVYWIP